VVDMPRVPDGRAGGVAGQGVEQGVVGTSK